MNLDHDLRTMLRQRAEGIKATPVVPDRTMRRVRVRKAVWAGGTLAVVVLVVLTGTLAVRSTLLSDSAPQPPADRGERGEQGEREVLPPPPGDLEGTLVSTGFHKGSAWWLGAWIDKSDFLCVEYLLEGGQGGSGCGPGPGRGELRGIVPSTSSGDLFTLATVFGAARSDIARVELIESDGTQSVETTPAPPDLGEDVRFFIFFASSPKRIVGYDIAGNSVARVDLERWLDSPNLDLEEVIGRGTFRGVDWALTATPSDEGVCYGFEHEGGGGSACGLEPDSEWFGEASQEVDPRKPSFAPVYGAMPTAVDEVRVVLDDGAEIPALILRPEGHRFAYYLAWLPDALTPGEVRFASGERVLGARELCASRFRARSDLSGHPQGFSCTGRVAGR
jgi:hypothetical protein